ncbi:MAG TPA: hypothetical protein DFM08_18685, partial [Pseudomonas sp.]|nr:hypothetical protein [Pseudomonas sp.]
ETPDQDANSRRKALQRRAIRPRHRTTHQGSAQQAWRLLCFPDRQIEKPAPMNAPAPLFTPHWHAELELGYALCA